MTVAHLQLAPVLVVDDRWSTNLIVVFVTSDVFCTNMIDYE